MRRLLPLALLLLLCSLLPAVAQPTDRVEIGNLRLEGNRELSDEMILAVLRTRETPWGIWKFVYRNISEGLGQKAEYFDPIAFEADVRTVRQLYLDQGFYHARVDTQILFRPEDGEVDLTFSIEEGRRSFVDTIEYRGAAELPGDVQEELHSNQLIERGDPFVLSVADAELRRLVEVFANAGYLGVGVDTVIATRYASTNNFTLVYSFIPGRRYQFGEVTVIQDSTVEQTVEEAVVLRHLEFREGDYFSEAKKVESERNLNRLGVFEASKIENALAQIGPDVTHVPVNVMVRARPFQELTPEIGVSDENNAFNILTGVGYNHRNFFGGARNFSARLRFNLQSIGTISFLRVFSQTGLRDSTIVAKTEISTQLVQPYFFNNKTSLSITLSGILDKQRSYYLPIIRSRIGMIAQTATYTRTFLDWNLELVDPRTVSTQRDTTFEGFTKQFNSIITATIQRDKRDDIFVPSTGFFHSFSVEESGLIPRAIGRPLGIDLPFSQYVKVNAVGQWYWDPSLRRSWIWGLRVHGGMAFLYGDNGVEPPPTQLFYAGGSGSVRGWKARDLGSVPRPEYGGRALLEANLEGRWNLLQGAGTLWFLELEKFSTVFFLDAGNLWRDASEIRAKEIALAAGFGIRYNTVAGPIRIDFGMRMFDPSAPPGREWVTSRRFFPEVFSGGVIHLGVGHAF